LILKKKKGDQGNGKKLMGSRYLKEGRVLGGFRKRRNKEDG